MENNLPHLLHTCGLSQVGAARLLDVNYNTLKAWYYGRNPTPEGVIKDLTEYAQAAERIFKKS